jgi:hypothetical protein
VFAHQVFLKFFLNSGVHDRKIWQEWNIVLETLQEQGREIPMFSWRYFKVVLEPSCVSSTTAQGLVIATSKSGIF